MFMRDDEMTNVNVGAFFKAPSYTDPDALACYLIREIQGDYRADDFTGHHLNTPDR